MFLCTDYDVNQISNFFVVNNINRTNWYIYNNLFNVLIFGKIKYIIKLTVKEIQFIWYEFYLS